MSQPLLFAAGFRLEELTLLQLPHADMARCLATRNFERLRTLKLFSFDRVTEDTAPLFAAAFRHMPGLAELTLVATTFVDIACPHKPTLTWDLPQLDYLKLQGLHVFPLIRAPKLKALELEMAWTAEAAAAAVELCQQAKALQVMLILSAYFSAVLPSSLFRVFTTSLSTGCWPCLRELAFMPTADGEAAVLHALSRHAPCRLESLRCGALSALPLRSLCTENPELRALQIEYALQGRTAQTYRMDRQLQEFNDKGPMLLETMQLDVAGDLCFDDVTYSALTALELHAQVHLSSPAVVFRACPRLATLKLVDAVFESHQSKHKSTSVTSLELCTTDLILSRSENLTFLLCALPNLAHLSITVRNTGPPVQRAMETLCAWLERKRDVDLLQRIQTIDFYGTPDPGAISIALAKRMVSALPLSLRRFRASLWLNSCDHKELAAFSAWLQNTRPNCTLE